MENSPILISCSELFIQRISSVSTEQLQNHVERSQEQNLERSNPGYESARRTSGIRFKVGRNFYYQ